MVLSVQTPVVKVGAVGMEVGIDMNDTITDDLFSNLGPKYTVPRPVQRDIMGQLLRDKPKVALAECPTGIGKSAIAVAYGDALVADHERSELQEEAGKVWPQSVILTATISLQQQYEADFNDLVLVKGRGNFECLANGLSAAEGACTIDKDAECESPYYEMRWRARGAQRTVANYSLYLSELFYARGFLGSHKPRTLLVCDEAHRLLDQLTEFEKRKLDADLVERLGLDSRMGWASLEAASLWARENLTRIHDSLTMAVTKGDKSARQWLTLFHQAGAMATVPEDFITLKTGPVVEAAPLWPRRAADTLFRSAEHVLLMSATMYGGHLLAELLGLRDAFGGQVDVEREEPPYNYYTVPSPFDPNRWPVHVRPVVSLNARSTDEEWGAMSEKVHEYVHNFHQTKGVIHVTAKIQVEKVCAALCVDCRSRVLRPSHDETRAETLTRFREGPAGLWLIHYSVGEGESFDDEGARIQLIVKTPYPDLGDKLTRLRSEDSSVGRKMYAGMTLAKVGQIAGRVMRHDKDYGETVILDGSFNRLWSWHKQLAPAWLHTILRF